MQKEPSPQNTVVTPVSDLISIGIFFFIDECFAFIHFVCTAIN
ncbi:unnamed protein product [Haemonchus placei]|uniref:Transposase n=1 Tax=Haemonchus placei TaxID=6290 RepID=A0A0N4W340_HAEPC|nr:unnamed protein product [Haemonchus placei]